MVSAERIPCINPRCRRTFKREHEDQETVCGDCFRMLPDAVRIEHRGFWREIRKWDRRITRTSDELKIESMKRARRQVSAKLAEHWDAHIKGYFSAPEKPVGLETFLEEIGLGSIG